jgi:crotonobetainyl-CoA:carnitine CoA-transferase CaiB-like acyl-CoA transferase
MTGQVDERAGVLSGLRVVEMASFIFAPAAATMMSDFGAEVIKIEPPVVGDPYRYLYRLPPLPVADMNYCWLLEARNKKSVAIDLKTDAGREILLKLVRTADVFVTNYQPSVLDALRLSYAQLQPLNEKLIYAHATGYGEVGPAVEQPGFDMTAFWARSGLMDGVVAADSQPALSLAGMGDHPAAAALFGAIMLALYRRERTGQGTKVSSSLVANGVWANGCMLQAELCGGQKFVQQSRSAPFNVLVNHYVARDGKRFLLCCLKPELDWPRLCQAVGREALSEDARFSTVAARRQHARELVVVLDACFAAKDLAEWTTIFDAFQVVYSPVPSPAEVVCDPQLTANEVFVAFDDPRLEPLRTINSPIFVAGEPKRRPQAPPTLGQHTREVLGSLSYSQETIERLATEKVIQV